MKIKKHRAKKILAVLLAFVILVPLSNYFLTPKKAEAAWYNDNWFYREAVPIATHTASETNVYITFQLDTATLITNGKLQSSCQDIRVTDISGNLLAYHVGRTNACNNAATTIDALVPTMPAGAQTYYVYYGNPSAVSKDAGAFSQSQCGNSCTTNPTLAAEEKGPSPVAYFKFNEATGTTANDSSTNSNTGTLSGTTVPAWKTEDLCISSKCLFFDGSTSYVAAGSGASIKITGNLTLAAWVRLTTVNAVHDIIAKRGANASGVTGYAYRLYTNASGQVAMDISSDGTSTNTKTATGSTGLTANQWYYVVGVYTTSTSITVYVNGIQDGQNTTSIPSSINNNSSIALELAVENGNGTRINYLTGFMDEVKIYNYARSSSQVLTDYNSRGNAASSGSNLGANQNNNPNALSNGLVGYWKMDETTAWTNDCSTTSVTDSSGNGNNAKSCPNTTGPTGVANGNFGFAGSFDGSDDYIDGGNGSSLQVTSSLTLSAWINLTTNSAVHDIIAKDGASGSFGYRLFTDASGKLNMEVSSDGTTTTSKAGATTITTSAWHHVVGVYNPSNSITVYVDGIQDGQTTSSIPTSINNPSSNLNLGAQNAGGSNLMSGTIDEARIYNRSLSGGDIANLSSFAPGPIGYWNFEDGSGSTLKDVSTNANSGAWQGTASYPPGRYGGAGNFDGTTNWIRVTNPASKIFDFGTTGSFTYEVWFFQRAVVGTFDTLIHKGGSSTPNNPGFDMELKGTGDWVANLADSGSTTQAIFGTQSTFTGKWTHLAAVANRSNNTLYVYANGVLKATVAFVGTGTFTNTKNIGIGAQASSGTPKVNGQIDDIRIYNYARSSQQVVEDMNAGHPTGGSPVGTPYGYWKFNEGADNTCSGGTNDACNSGFNGSTLDGAQTNMAVPATSTSGWTNSGKFGKALIFDGSDDRLDVGDLTRTETATQITQTFWVNPTSLATSRCIFCKVNAPNGSPTQASWAIMTDSSDSSMIRTIVTSSNTAVSTYGQSPTGMLTNSTWAHVAIVYDGTQATNADRIKMYINGISKSVTITGTIPTTGPAASTSNARMGTSSDAAAGTFFTGTLDEVKVYLGALTPQQVLIDMNGNNSQVLGALSDNSSYQKQAANQEYCVPGDTTSCVSPVVEIKFEEGSGTTANDSSVTGNTGTWNGTSSHWIIGKIGTAGNFNSSNSDYLSFASSSTYKISGSLSVSLWFKTSVSSGNPRLISTNSTQNVGYDMTLVSATGKLQFNVAPGGTQAAVYSNAAVNNNIWHHAEGTWDGATEKLYIDGVLQDSASGTGSISYSQNLLIGASNSDTPTNYFTGSIDQVRVFNYTRSVAQAAWDYNKGAPVGYWKFDECQGSTANDSSGNSNNGTIAISTGGSQTTTIGFGTCNTNASTPWYNGVTGKKNYSINLDGTDDNIQVSAFSPLAIAGLTTTKVSWGGWFYPTSSAASKTLIEKATNATTAGEFHLTTNSSSQPICGIFYSSAFNDSSAPSNALTLNAWNHIVCVYDGTNINTYLNGLLIKQSSNTNSITAASSILYMGQSSTGTQFYSGQIDDILIYNYALTLTQVQTLYNNGAVNFAPSTGAP